MRSDEYRLENSENTLLNSSLYQLYLKNEYDALISACEALPAEEWRDSCFFYSLAQNYMGPIFKRYDAVDFSDLTMEEKCAYLFNIDSLEIQRTWKHNSQKLKQFIRGIPDQKNRGALSQYTEVYEGNAKRLLKLQQSLSKLKEQYEGNHTFIGCSSLDELYKIKRSAMEVYQFYFANRLFHIRFSELKTIMRVYAESIICTNGEHESPRKSIWGESSAKAKYPVNMIDFDVLTKFLSIKELNELLETYNIKEINLDSNMKNHAVSCYKNISNSIVKATLYNRFLSAPSILINCMQLLCYIDLQPEHQDIIRKVIEELLEDKTFVAYFFSTNFPEWRLAAKVLLQLMEKVSFVSRSIDPLWNLLGITDFQDYLVNSNMSTNQDLVCFFAGEMGNSQQVQNYIYDHIKSYDKKRQCRIIRLLRKIIKDEAIKNDLTKYISEHFYDLDRYDIIDFAFCGWLSISPEQSTRILEEAIRLKKAEVPGMHSYPDPFESQLELICLLYITEVIKDISLLQPIAKESEFLMFFFDDPALDYSKIDFTHYMWGNIIRTPRFTEHIKKHKDAIIPVIQQRIDIDVATEFERKLLYGKLMDNVF